MVPNLYDVPIFLVRLQAETAGYTPKFHFQLRVGVKLCWLKSPEKNLKFMCFKNP